MSVVPTLEGRRSWRGVSAGDRAAERRGLLLDAAFELLGVDGWQAVTVRGVCRAARLHPRYFYQAFEDLDDLLTAVFDRLVDELHVAVSQSVTAAGRGSAARTRAGLEAVARFVSDDRRRARVLYTEALENDRLNRRRTEAFEQFVVLQEPGGVGAHIVVGGFTSALVAWLDGRLDVTLDELVDNATSILLAARAAARRIASQSAVADAL